MKRDHRGIEDVLRQSRPPEVPQMAPALARVWNRLGADRGTEGDAPMVVRDAARRSRHSAVWTTAAAAALVIVAVGGAMVWPRGVRVYAAGADGLEVTLTDDSRVEMRAHAEMAVDRASDGILIDLKTGDIIVTVAKQRDGQLSVRTKDMTVALSAVAHAAKADGTIALVNAAEDGSRVAVIQGEARVREGASDTRVRPGEQVSTSATLAARPVKEEIAWSRNGGALLTILESFTRGIAATVGPLEPLRPAPGALHVQAQADRNAAGASPREFEEAAVRECDPDNLPPTPTGARGGGPNSFQMTPGRLYALCMTPAVMIRVAYGFRALPEGSLSSDTRRAQGWRLNEVSGQGANAGIAVRGAPDWARNDRYSVEAVAAADTDGDTMSGPMFRSLLERRFKLKTHVATEGVPAWTLTVSPGGLKIKPMAPGGCEENPPVPPGTKTRPPRTLEEVRGGAKPTCGIWWGGAERPRGGAERPNGGNAVWLAGGGTIEDIVSMIRRQLNGADVVDKTGVTGQFNFILEVDAGDRAIVSAVTDQLGLRLAETRASREYLVIDSIEKPGPN
jgi:uncharacterized protein (TIGR03435 family)